MRIHYGKADDLKRIDGLNVLVGDTICGNFQVPTTEDITEVTCKNCLKQIELDLNRAKEKVFGKELK